MKGVLLIILFVACVLGSLTQPNKTQGQETEQGPSVVTKLCWTFFNITVGLAGLYYYGLSTGQKLFSTVVNKEQSGQELDPNLWYIHGKAYDLAEFMTKHPGGYRPLMVSRGRDATELFESYHSLTDKPRAILQKFAVPAKDIKDYKSIFNWDLTSKTNAFTAELRQRVREHVKKNNLDTMAPTRIVVYSYAVTALSAWLTYKYYWTGAWWSTIVIPTLWWISFIQTFHDATHFAFSKNELHSAFWVHLYPYFSSPTTWDHQHVIGHHIYTNIFKKDPDLNHGMPIFRIHPRFSYRPWFRFQVLWVWLVWSVSTFYLSVVYDWVGLSSGVYHGVLPYQKLSNFRIGAHLFGRIVSVFLTCGIPFTLYPFWQALFWSVSFYGVFGFLFMLVTQINHIVDGCLDEAEPNECWAAHQVKTSHGFSHGSWLWWMLSGGLNFQIEHHLFPGINSNHLPGIAPIVQELCKKHNIPYNYSADYFQAVKKYLTVIWRNSENKSLLQKLH